jgi:hypothetical protein
MGGSFLEVRGGIDVGVPPLGDQYRKSPGMAEP